MAAPERAAASAGWFSASRLKTVEAPRALAIQTLILFLVLEYIRPPLLHQLRLPMVIIVVMALLWLTARKRPWSGILTAQVFFFVLCLQAVPFASNNYAALETSRIMFGHLVIALSFSWLLVTRATFQKVVWAWLLIMGYVSIYGILSGGTGPGAMLGDENDLALGCATAFPFAFYAFEQLSGTRRWLALTIGALLVAAIVLSFSRGGFVALAVGGVYCWLASRYKLRSFIAVVLAAVVLMVAAPKMGRTGESYVDRLWTMFNTEEGTVEARRFLWAAARNMWAAHPILGVGAGNYPYLVGQYQPKDFNLDRREYHERDWSGSATHSIYFQILAEHGSVGVVLLSYIVWAHFRTIRRLRQNVASQPGLPPDVRRDVDLYGGALAGAVVAFCAAGAFLSVTYYPYFWYFSAMAVALERLVQREIDTRRDSQAASFASTIKIPKREGGA